MTESVEGGCLCGAVRYRATGATSHPTLCHCASCRRASAAPMVAWVTFPKDGFRFVRGEPGRHRSSERVERTFCPRCGTPLTYVHDAFPDAVDVTTCSLDDPAAFPPADHTWLCHRLPWMAREGALPSFPRSRHDGS